MSEELSKLRPLNDNVILEIIERKEVTAGGIYIPKSAKDQELAWQAQVVAVGTGRVLDNGSIRPVGVEVGQKVVLGKYLGTEVEVGGNKFVVVKEDHILGIIEEV